MKIVFKILDHGREYKHIQFTKFIYFILFLCLNLLFWTLLMFLLQHHRSQSGLLCVGALFLSCFSWCFYDKLRERFDPVSLWFWGSGLQICNAVQETDVCNSARPEKEVNVPLVQVVFSCACKYENIMQSIKCVLGQSHRSGRPLLTNITAVVVYYYCYYAEIKGEEENVTPLITGCSLPKGSVLMFYEKGMYFLYLDPPNYFVGSSSGIRRKYNHFMVVHLFWSSKLHAFFSVFPVYVCIYVLSIW